MTERERLLEAVVKHLDFGGNLDAWLNLKGAVLDMESSPTMPPDSVCWRTLHRVLGQLSAARTALDALDAHQPQPAAGETVTVAVWRVGDHYEWTVPGLLRGNHCTRLGTTALRLDPEVRT